MFQEVSNVNVKKKHSMGLAIEDFSFC
jgi:hypothetical protein